MLASGVRRSCDTASSRADLRASLWRAISVSVAARRSSSRRRARPSWSAARASSRVASRPGSAASGGSSARSQPSVSSSASIRIFSSVPVPVPVTGRPDLGLSWARTQRAGCSPGVLARAVVNGEAGSGAPGRESARTRDRAPRSATIQARASPASGTRRATIPAPAVSRSGAVASKRLIANSEVDSAARRAASCVRSAPSAARRPTTIATNRNSSRSSHSRGSATTRLKRGSVKTASYTRNAATAVPSAAHSPKLRPAMTTGTR